MNMSIWGYPYPTEPKVETKEEPTPAVAPTVGGTVLYSPPSGENGAAGTPVAELYPSAVPPKNDAVPNGNKQGSAGSVMPPQASAGSGVLYTPGSQAPTSGDPLSYAQWLYGKSVYDAEQTRIKAEKQAETDRQRAIVDANSAYQQGLATYGANAEAVAGMGLSGSGYGEYLTGKAYATKRGEVQSANVAAQARKDQALYEENSSKAQAAQIYANDLIGIKNQQTADYGALYDAATQGTSIEALMQDGRWASLTVDQRSAIRQITSANSLKAQLDGGASLDEIVADANSGWGTLTVDAQQQLTNYYNTITSAKKAESDKNFAAYLDGIIKGTYTLEDVKNLSGYSKLSPEQKERLESAYDSDINVKVSSLSEAYKDNWNNLNDVKKTLSGLGYSENIITDFVSRWQQANYDLLVSELQNTWSSQNVDPIKELESDIDNGLLSENSGKKLLNAMKTVLETPVIVGGVVETRPHTIKIYYQFYPEEWKTAVLTILEGGRLPGDTSSDLPKLGGPASGNYKNAYHGDVDKLIKETRNKYK